MRSKNSLGELDADADNWAASPMHMAACSAFGSVCVIRVERRMNSRSNSGRSPYATPMTGARMHGPLPAENTPLRVGDQPSQRRRHANSVALPIAGGQPMSHQRSRQPSEREKCGQSVPAASSACAVMQACSVSSENMPRRNKKW